MTLEPIKIILMRRDGMSEREADELIEEAKEAVIDYLEEDDFLGAENVCAEYFGLEPDYLWEIIPL